MGSAMSHQPGCPCCVTTCPSCQYYVGSHINFSDWTQVSGTFSTTAASIYTRSQNSLILADNSIHPDGDTRFRAGFAWTFSGATELEALFIFAYGNASNYCYVKASFPGYYGGSPLPVSLELREVVAGVDSLLDSVDWASAGSILVCYDAGSIWVNASYTHLSGTVSDATNMGSMSGFGMGSATGVNPTLAVGSIAMHLGDEECGDCRCLTIKRGSVPASISVEFSGVSVVPSDPLYRCTTCADWNTTTFILTPNDRTWPFDSPTAYGGIDYIEHDYYCFYTLANIDFGCEYYDEILGWQPIIFALGLHLQVTGQDIGTMWLSLTYTDVNGFYQEAFGAYIYAESETVDIGVACGVIDLKNAINAISGNSYSMGDTSYNKWCQFSTSTVRFAAS